MPKCYLLLLVTVFACQYTAHAQASNKLRFRLGANIAFGLSHIAHNDVGIGGLVGVEKTFNKIFAGELEASYTYFAGDKVFYVDGKNKAWALPLLAGIRVYPERWLYASAKIGAIGFVINDMTSTHIRPAFGVAAGMNLPEKNNRLNLQLGYTGFGHGGSRGYATLAAAIIIN